MRYLRAIFTTFLLNAAIAAATAVAIGVAIAATPSSAGAQTVSGVVAERVNARVVPGATVTLSGSPPHVTDDDGRFRFFNVTPGRYTLTVAAFGYGSASTEIIVRADTTIRFILDPAPLDMDSLTARATKITVRGNIRDAQTGEKLLQSQLYVSPDNRMIGAMSGDFTIRNLHRGDSITISFEAIEHLPLSISFVADRDTTLDVRMKIDSVAIKIIAREIARLNLRARAVPFSLNTRGPKELRGSLTVGAALRHMLPAPAFEIRPPYDLKEDMVPCIFLDDRQVHWYDIRALAPELIERIEVFGLKGKMIRIYRREYVARLMSVKKLPRLVYMENGLHVTCN